MKIKITKVIFFIVLIYFLILFIIFVKIFIYLEIKKLQVKSYLNRI